MIVKKNRVVKFLLQVILGVIFIPIGCTSKDQNKGHIIEDVNLNKCMYFPKDAILDDIIFISNNEELTRFVSNFSHRTECVDSTFEYNLSKVSILGMPTITFGSEIIYRRKFSFNENDNKWYYEINTIIEERSIDSKILNFNLVTIPKTTPGQVIVYVMNNQFIGEIVTNDSTFMTKVR